MRGLVFTESVTANALGELVDVCAGEPPHGEDRITWLWREGLPGVRVQAVDVLPSDFEQSGDGELRLADDFGQLRVKRSAPGSANPSGLHGLARQTAPAVAGGRRVVRGRHPAAARRHLLRARPRGRRRVHRAGLRRDHPRCRPVRGFPQRVRAGPGPLVPNRREQVRPGQVWRPGAAAASGGLRRFARHELATWLCGSLLDLVDRVRDEQEDQATTNLRPLKRMVPLAVDAMEQDDALFQFLVSVRNHNRPMSPVRTRVAVALHTFGFASWLQLPREELMALGLASLLMDLAGVDDPASSVRALFPQGDLGRSPASALLELARDPLGVEPKIIALFTS